MKSRTALIKLIHVAKRELGWDELVYRDVLLRYGGADSCQKITSIQKLEAVLLHMKAKGFRLKIKPKTRPLASDPQSKKIRALWLSLKELGAITDASEAALAAFVKRQTKVEALQWLNQAQAEWVIESLKQWEKRIVLKKEKDNANN